MFQVFALFAASIGGGKPIADAKSANVCDGTSPNEPSPVFAIVANNTANPLLSILGNKANICFKEAFVCAEA
jgi:hypothetical protein